MCLQQDDIAALKTKSRCRNAELELRNIADTYAVLLEHSFAMDHDPRTLEVRGYGEQHRVMIALQKTTIALAKEQMTGGTAGTFDDTGIGADTFNDDGALRTAEPALVSLPMSAG